MIMGDAEMHIYGIHDCHMFDNAPRRRFLQPCGFFDLTQWNWDISVNDSRIICRAQYEYLGRSMRRPWLTSCRSKQRSEPTVNWNVSCLGHLYSLQRLLTKEDVRRDLNRDAGTLREIRIGYVGRCSCSIIRGSILIAPLRLNCIISGSSIPCAVGVISASKVYMMPPHDCVSPHSHTYNH